VGWGTAVVKKDMITATCNFKLADFVSVTEGAPQDDSMDTA
jgi:hypothetical protein